MSNNKINRPSSYRGRLSELEKKSKPTKRMSQKAYDAQRMRVLSYLKNSYENETMMEFRKRTKDK